MSDPVNIFENNVETVLIDIIEESMPPTLHVKRGETHDTQLLPLCYIVTTEVEEAIYQSGVYRATVEFTVKDDLDKGSPEESAELFAELLDLLQNPQLQTQMNDSPTVVIKGIVLGNQRVNEVGDRMWIKSVQCDFFGFAVSS